MFSRGQMYSGIAKWFELLNLQFVGRTTFYKYQRQLVIPQIQRHYRLSLEQAREEIIDKGRKQTDVVFFNQFLNTYTI